MSYSEMLHEFMENELPSNREETLFHALARDEDLRFEMKYLLSLRSAVREDDEAGVVPLATTQALFTRLGYGAVVPVAESVAGAAGATGAAAGSAAGTAAGTGLGSIFRGWGTHLLAGLLGMLLAGSFFLLGEPAAADRDRAGRSDAESQTIAAVDDRSPDENAPPSRTDIDAAERERAVDLAAGSVAGNVPVVNAPIAAPNGPRRANGSATGPMAKQDRQSRSEAAVTTTAEQTDQRADLSQIDATTMRAVELQPADSRLSDPTSPAELLGEADLRSATDRPVQLPGQEYETYGDWSFTARGSMVPVDLATSKLGLDMSRGDGLERNFALGLAYSLTPEVTVGIETGVDSYLMYFREERPGGIINEFEAFSSPLWVGATARWSPLAVGPFPLFLQGSLGGSHAGAMGRLMVGGEFDLEKSVTLIGGAELSAVGYQFDNSLSFTPRLGLTGGIRLNNLFEKK